MLTSTLNAADAAHAAQFVAGFYQIEQNQWRWTGRQFVAQLSPPAGTEGRTLKLSIAFNVTERMLKDTPSVTVSCAADGQPLPPETYSKPSSYRFLRPLPGPTSAPIVQIACQVDHTFVASENGDTRELGIMVTRISLL
jgi:hypothetical protein